jgi:hypothetical protein
MTDDQYETEKENLRRIGLGEDWITYPGSNDGGLAMPEINWKAVSAANDRRSRGKAALQEDFVRNVPPRRAEEGLPPTPEIDWREVSRQNDSRRITT